MSYASTRKPITQFTPDILTSVNVGSIIELGNNIAIIPIPTGTETNILDVNLPYGLYGGWIQIAYTGDNTTVITRMDMLVRDENGDVIDRTNILTATTLPDANTNYFSLPYSNSFLAVNQNKVSYSILATYAGTAIGINANGIYFKATKFV